MGNDTQTWSPSPVSGVVPDQKSMRSASLLACRQEKTKSLGVEIARFAASRQQIPE
jgi:hypothetical protein